MFGSYFGPVEQGVIAGSAVAALVACYLHVRKRDGLALWLLLLAAFAMRLMVSQLDPFLNTWDENIHAVVAKNMAERPFVPMLYTDTALDLGIASWDQTHIWLHKQPFFLWMIALSIKMLGPTVVALRLPSALFTTALVFFTHGIGRAMHGRDVAFMAAMFAAWSYWIMMLVLGAAMLDHNDAIFISLVAGAFWGWMRWRDSMSTKRAVVIGLFMGCAVLTKWLPGFLLMGGWAVVALADKEHRLQELRWMAVSYATSLLIAVPWQITAWVRWPVVMANETKLNSLHLWEVVEQHGGNWDYYFQSINTQFPLLPGWLLFGGLVLAILMTKRRDFRLMAIVSVAMTYGVYSMAATKMNAFPMLIIPFFFVGLAFLVQWVAQPLPSTRRQTALMMLLTLVLSGALLDLERIQKWHTAQAQRDGFIWWLRGDNLHNLEVMDKLAGFIGSDHGTGVVVYNVPFPATMDMMYFHGHQVLPSLPKPEMVEKLVKLGRRVIIVDPPEEAEVGMVNGVQYFRTGGRGFRQPPT